VKEVTAAGFQLIRGPESWRGRTYAVLFRRPQSEDLGVRFSTSQGDLPRSAEPADAR
jgi:hypothetical protein